MADPVLPWTTPTVTARNVTDQETVAGQLTGLLAKNNSYLQAARSNAADTMRSRGMLQSSIGVGAGETAAIEAAAPIAAQDASTYAASGLSAQNANQDMTKQTQEQQMTAQREKLAAGYTMEQNKFLANADYQKLMANLSSEDKRSFNSSMASLSQQYINEFNAVQRDTSMSTEGKGIAMENLQSEFAAKAKSLSSIFGYKVNWSTNTNYTS